VPGRLRREKGRGCGRGGKHISVEGRVCKNKFTGGLGPKRNPVASRGTRPKSNHRGNLGEKKTARRAKKKGVRITKRIQGAAGGHECYRRTLRCGPREMLLSLKGKSPTAEKRIRTVKKD